MRKIKEEYFDWILDQVTVPEIHYNYLKLFRILYETEFTWTIEYDENRAADGIDLRSKFAEQMGYSYEEWRKNLDDRPCSLLEMMAALAIRCEDCIMGDADYGDRTDIWFWNMIVTMGLKDEDDEEIDVIYVKERVKRVLNRDYAADGYGGFFYVPGRTDLQKSEIWYQLNYWLNQFYN